MKLQNLKKNIASSQIWHLRGREGGRKFPIDLGPCQGMVPLSINHLDSGL